MLLCAVLDLCLYNFRTHIVKKLFEKSKENCFSTMSGNIYEDLTSTIINVDLQLAEILFYSSSKKLFDFKYMLGVILVKLGSVAWMLKYSLQKYAGTDIQTHKLLAQFFWAQGSQNEYLYQNT